MLEWFSHQCIGDEVNIMEPFSHLCNDWIGIAVCVVFCSLPRHQIQSDYPVSCRLTVNGKVFNSVPGEWLFYQIILNYFICYLNSSRTRSTENHHGNVMQMDFVRLELKLLKDL